MKRSLNIYILFVLASALGANGLQAQTKQPEDSLLKVLQICKEDTTKAMLLNKIAGIVCDKAQYDLALKYCIEALGIYQKKSDKINEAYILGNIATIFKRLMRYDEAITYYEKALAIKTESGDKKGEALLYSNMASVFFERSEFDKCIAYCKKGLELEKTIGEKKVIVNCKTNMGNAYVELKKYHLALIEFNDAVKLAEEMKDTTAMVLALSSVGQLKTNTNKFKEAIEINERALSLIKNGENTYLLEVVNEGLYNAHKGAGEYDKALEYLEKVFRMYQNSISDETTEKVSQLKEKYEAEKREQAILLLKEQSKAANALAEKRTLYFIIALVSGVFLLLLVLLVNRNRKKQQALETDKDKAVFELQALMAQMNPHFIFNALNSIQHYILERSKQEAYDYLAKFSKLIRIVLNNSEEKIIPLNRELEMIKLYVDLEQMRFANKFEFYLNVADNINTENVTMPTMLIQPYIENAIWHGLMNLEDKKNRVLKVEITKQDKHLKICVEDNGIGRAKAAEFKTKDMHKPVAMKLTEKRLAMINKMKGYENTKVIVCDLYDEKNIASGTRVEILLPI